MGRRFKRLPRRRRRQGRLAAAGDIPEADAEVGSRFRNIRHIDIAAVVFAVRADGINDNAVGQPAVDQGFAGEGIVGHGGDEVGYKYVQGWRPVSMLAAVAFGGEGCGACAQGGMTTGSGP